MGKLGKGKPTVFEGEAKRKRGRPPTYRDVTLSEEVSIALPPETYDLISGMAENAGTTVSGMARRILAAGLSEPFKDVAKWVMENDPMEVTIDK